METGSFAVGVATCGLCRSVAACLRRIRNHNRPQTAAIALPPMTAGTSVSPSLPMDHGDQLSP